VRIAGREKLPYNAVVATFRQMSNVPSTAVIQVKQGIGDVVWHLPFIRAIAATTREHAVTFLTLPSTRARELLQAEPGVGEVVYFEHKGSELQRGLHLARLVALLRARKFQRIWILDRTIRPALAARLAGIPQRIGPGDGVQRHFLTNRPIDPQHYNALVIDWLRALMATMNVPLASTEPDLALPVPVLAAIAARYGALPRPWTVLALGASLPQKDWADASWSALLEALRRRAAGTVFLVGGPDQSARAAALIARAGWAALVNACDLTIVEAAALLRLADLFVGPDSAPLNLAAAGGTPAFGMFGATPVQTYSRHIHAITPDDGWDPDGMRRISPDAVLRRIEPYLGVTKDR
jgi:heptosyltransferase II